MLKNQPEDIKLRTGKFNGIYRGVVEENVDDLKMGRVRVRIFGLHTSRKTKSDTEGIPTSELPWAEPACSLIEGSISGFGLWAVPLKGSHVFLFFENGNYTQPRYFATIPGIPTQAIDTSVGFNDPDGVYPSTLNESDFHRCARGTKQTVTSPAYNATYPYNIVLATHGGHVIEIDNTPGQERINVHHNVGTYAELDKDGNKTEAIIKDHIKSVAGNRTETIGSNETVTIGGNKAVTISGNWNVTVTGNTTFTVTGDATVTADNAYISSDNIELGTGTKRGLLDSRAATVYDSHTHDHGDPAGTTDPPNQLLGGSNQTTETTAS